ncbi:hypothetical protein L2E82_09088 [Cichorium intybus]|uniref:Uncharacterized protein n=1 Tax=Cichorium intybus TaxID=13427 RepID=A0ACB9G7H3_CICIN|nr:hypothetical protein L2E82_09088 [Cichorium intybus]
MTVPKSKYEEDVYINNHTYVWGSWWKEHQWGYKCCKQFVRNSYCTGAAGIQAAEAASDLMKANIARKEATQEVIPPPPPPNEDKNLATWGTDIPHDLVLDQGKLLESLKKIFQESIPGRKGLWIVYHTNSRNQPEHSKTASEDDEYHAYLIISLESRTMVLQMVSNLEEVIENVDYFVQGSTIYAGNLFGR